MNAVRIGLMFAVCAILLGAQAQKRTPSLTSDGTPGELGSARPGEPAGGAWLEVSPAGEGFSVSMPGQPSQQTVGGNANFQAHLLEADTVAYMIMSKRIPSDARKGKAYVELSLKGSALGYKAGFEAEAAKQGEPGKMVFDYDVELDGHPGKQYHIVSKQMPGVLRIYATDDYVFFVQIRGVEPGDALVAKFFDSFRIL